MKPEISVLMSVYNGQERVGAAVESLLAQTFQDFELLIVDDASTDATPEILSGYEDPRLRVLHNDRNLGLTRSLNRALPRANAPLVARQDHDDVSVPGRLQRQVAYMRQHPECVALSSWYELVTEEGEVHKRRPPVRDTAIRWKLLFGTPLAHPALMARTAALRKIDGYDEALPFAQDYDLECRLADVGRLHNLPEYLVTKAERSRAISVSKGDEQRRLAQQIGCRRIGRLLGSEPVRPELRGAARQFLVGRCLPTRVPVEAGVKFSLKLARRFAEAHDCPEFVSRQLAFVLQEVAESADRHFDGGREQALQRARASWLVARSGLVTHPVKVPISLLAEPSLVAEMLEEREAARRVGSQEMIRQVLTRCLLSEVPRSQLIGEFRRRRLVDELPGTLLLKAAWRRLRRKITGKAEHGPEA